VTTDRWSKRVLLEGVWHRPDPYHEHVTLCRICVPGEVAFVWSKDRVSLAGVASWGHDLPVMATAVLSGTGRCSSLVTFADSGAYAVRGDPWRSLRVSSQATDARLMLASRAAVEAPDRGTASLACLY
jgi:hypothetical protein